MNRIIRFAFVGAAGFLIDAAVLSFLLATLPVGPYVSRLISISVALSATWLLNRHLTFGPSDRAMALEGARYGGVGFATAFVNYVVYSACIFSIPQIPPILALVIGSAVAMLLSYFGYARLVFSR